MSRDIEFSKLAEAALNRARQLLEQWLPDGRLLGEEYKALNPTRADNKAGSFSINVVTGEWGDFAVGDKGGDLVSLYAYLFCGDNQKEAAYALADILGMPEAVPDKGDRPNTSPQPAQPVSAPAPEQKEVQEEKPKWRPIFPIPDHAGEPPVAHRFRGIPERVWRYFGIDGQTNGFVYRFRTSDGGKEVIPLTWCRHDKTGNEEWRWISFPEPRPLYGLQRLQGKDIYPVLVTEGEKCADVVDGELGSRYVGLTWPGGANAVDMADWSPIYGRRVVLWPDTDSKRKKLTKDEKAAGMKPEDKPYLDKNDQPGMKAMRWLAGHLTEHGCEVSLVTTEPPGMKPDGWDIADAVDEGMAGDQLRAHIEETAVGWVTLCGKSISTAKKAVAEKWEDGSSWRERLLYEDGELSDCLANIYDILANRKEWSKVVAFDEFSQRTVKLKAPPYGHAQEGEWESVDDSRTAMWLTRNEFITPSSQRVAEAVETLARSNPVHPVRDWLKALPSWDGIPRTEMWLCDHLGVRDTPYVRKVAQFFLVGMIARVMEPGCKFDYCLVLEGKQGKGKSTAFRILGGEWYGDTDLDLHNKDSMSALRGKWLYEFAELGSVTRAESTKQKSFLSRQVDEYRPVYGRREIKAPRQVVFGGTTNEWEWNKDPTGGRRFWPVDCIDDLNLEGLRDNRDQLFAEALSLYLAGSRYWPTPEEQKELFDPEQLLREQPESLVDALHDWVYGRTADFSTAMAVMEGLGLDASKLTRDMQTRVGNALRRLGCTKFEKRNGTVRYWYRPPQQGQEPQGQGASNTEKSGGRYADF